MPIAYQATTTFTAGNATTISGVSKPAGTAVGDVLIAQAYLESSLAIGTPTIASTGDTWTLVTNNSNTTPTPDFEHYVWICVVANASSTIGVTWDGDSIWRDFAVHRYTGVDTTTPQDVTATANTGTSTTITGLGLASGTAGREIVLLTAAFNNLTRSGWTSPLTERDDSENVATGSGTDSAGTDTGNKTATITSDSWSAIMLALRPAGGASITYFGSASNPVDGATAAQAGPGPVAVTPPTNMTAGDLVCMIGQYRGAVTLSVSETGGQTWTSETAVSNTNIAGRLFWCRFNGTWTADPSITNTTGTNALTVVMHVFRPTAGTKLWGVDVAQAELTFTAPSTPFTVTITAPDTIHASTVALAGWFTADDNTWGTLAGSGWATAGTAQYRNTTGQDQSCTFAYNIQNTAAVALADVSKNQATLGGDAGTTFIIVFYEYSPPKAHALPRRATHVFTMQHGRAR